MNLYDAIIDYMNEYWDSKGNLNFWSWLLQKGIDIKHDNAETKTICADFDGTKEEFNALIDKFERQFPSKPTYDLEERDLIEMLDFLDLRDKYYPEEQNDRDIVD